MQGEDPHNRIVKDSYANLTESEACSDVYLSAGAYGRYSEAIHINNIKSSEITIKSFSLNVNPSTNSVKVNWNWEAPLVCIETFGIEVCKNDECKEPLKVYQNKALPGGFTFTSTDLDPCSIYTISAKPLYKGKYLKGKVSTFKTLSPSLADVDLSVTAEVVNEGLINISWNEVECASSYEVFQIVGKTDARWETVGVINEPGFKLEVNPCTEYRFGVKVKINGAQSDIYEADLPAITPPPPVTIQPSLTITKITQTSVGLSVDHAYCITDYTVSVCTTNPNSCTERETMKNNESSITAKIENLSPCSPYSVNVLTTTNNTKQSLVKDFQTLPTYPIVPEKFTASFDPQTDRITFSFAQDSCASSYKIYKNVDGSQAIFFNETKNTSFSFDFMDGCGIRFAASAVVNGTEGPKKEFVVAACGAQASSALTVLPVAVSLIILIIFSILCINKHTTLCKNNQENNIREADIEQGEVIMNSVNDNSALEMTLRQGERSPRVVESGE